jgi:hypothetical protein
MTHLLILVSESLYYSVSSLSLAINLKIGLTSNKMSTSNYEGIINTVSYYNQTKGKLADILKISREKLRRNSQISRELLNYSVPSLYWFSL